MPGQFQHFDLKFIATDASDMAIAAAFISHPHIPTYRRYLQKQELTHSINKKELMAVTESCVHFTTLVQHSMVNIRSDNSTVCHCINSWGTKSKHFRPLLQSLFDWTVANRVCLTATYIPTDANKLADKMSRGGDPDDDDVLAQSATTAESSGGPNAETGKISSILSHITFTSHHFQRPLYHFCVPFSPPHHRGLATCGTSLRTLPYHSSGVASGTMVAPRIAARGIHTHTAS